MNGDIDESSRALLTVFVSGRKDQPKVPIRVWIDTAFNGGIVLPRRDVVRLGLQQASVAEAILADGRLVEVETFTCYLDWFGKSYRTQIVANDGEFALLGTQLLADRILTINYRVRTLSLMESFD